MKVTQKVRRKSDEKEVNGEPKWFEDDIYEDVAIEKAYVGRVSHDSFVRTLLTAHARTSRFRSCCGQISVSPTMSRWIRNTKSENVRSIWYALFSGHFRVASDTDTLYRVVTLSSTVPRKS